MSHKHILLIDDEETIQEVVQVGIEIETDWHVSLASSGIEGIFVAAFQQPDAILLDIMMPEMDGVATLNRLKENYSTRSIPVILLTAKAQASDKIQFKNLGVFGVITKPFNSLELPDKIAEILRWES